MPRTGWGENFIFGFHGYRVPDWLHAVAEEHGLGGVILFDYYTQTKKYENNIESWNQVRELVREIHALPSRPLTFIDQEGGKVRRLKEAKGFKPLPSAFAFNQLSRAEKISVASVAFQELVELGFDFDLAPVIDLNLNPENSDIGKVERSFSADADEVRENVAILAQIAKQVGLKLCLKHYPGMGGAKQNSHHELTDLSNCLDAEQEDLFFELAGQIPGEAVLVSHGIVNHWEKDLPVSVSGVALERLRRRLPEALLISDDLQMQGLQLKLTSLAASLRGLEAGLDLILIGNNMLNEEGSAGEIVRAVGERAANHPAFARQIQRAQMRVRARKER